MTLSVMLGNSARGEMTPARKKILLIGPYGIGNLIMAVPAIRALKALGGNEISIAALLPSTAWICQHQAPLAECFKDVYDLSARQGGLALLKKIWAIRRQRFDASIVLFPSAKLHYNVLSFLLGARLKIGSYYENQPWSQAYWLNSLRVAVQSGLHDCNQMIHLMNQGLNLQLPSVKDYQVQGPDKVPGLIGVHPGCKAADQHKKWSLEKFLQTALLISEKNPELRWHFFFGPDEKPDFEQFSLLIKHARYSSLVERSKIFNQLSLADLYRQIGQCEFFLSLDSGPMHIAASQGCKTLSVVGPSDEKRTGPFSPLSTVISHEISCRPCTHTLNARQYAFKCLHAEQYCLTQVTAQQVYNRWTALKKSAEKAL